MRDVPWPVLRITRCPVSATGRDADWRAENIDTVELGAQEFVAVDPAGVHHGLRIGLPGRYNVANCLLAAALLDTVGVSPEQAAPGLRSATVPGRLEPIDRGQDFLALVDYAHKPGALRAVLETLREQSSGRLAVVFGAGGNRDAGKREPMGRVAAELADLVVVTDDNPRDEDPADDQGRDHGRRDRAAARRRWSRSATAARPSTTRWRGRDRGTSC